MRGEAGVSGREPLGWAGPKSLTGTLLAAAKSSFTVHRAHIQDPSDSPAGVRDPFAVENGGCLSSPGVPDEVPAHEGGG